jgi:hypothetical protein
MEGLALLGFLINVNALLVLLGLDTPSVRDKTP